jgi:tetratricopeptide (TPR) repeat protein
MGQTESRTMNQAHEDPAAREAEDLLKRGLDAFHAGRIEEACDLLFEGCDRFTKLNLPVPPVPLSTYGLALGQTGKLKQGIEICSAALSHARSNASLHINLARLYVLAGARRKAIDAIERGLRACPRHPGLSRLRDEIGVRRRPVIPLLSRNHPANVALGRLRHRLASRGRRKTPRKDPR